MVSKEKESVLSHIKESNDPLIKDIFDRLNMSDAGVEPLYKSTTCSMLTDINIFWSPSNINRTFKIRAPVQWTFRHGKLTIDCDETAICIYNAAKKLKADAIKHIEEQTHEIK